MFSKKLKERLKKITLAYKVYRAARKVYRRLRRAFTEARPTLLTRLIALSRPVYALCREARDVPVVVSMASYRARFPITHIALKSILRQTAKPDKIVLNIDKEDEPYLPKAVLKLQVFGVEIKARDGQLKSHKKWLYAFQENPGAAIITVDDDIIYPKTMVEELLSSYKRHPDCVSARRVHMMTKDVTGRLNPYNEWRYEYKALVDEPSHSLFATTGGGTLFPSRRVASHALFATGCAGVLPPYSTITQHTLFDSECFNMENIRHLALNADDIWLKFMELRCGIKCVYVPCKRWGEEIRSKILKGTGLSIENWQGGNDICIEKMQKAYNINLAGYAVEDDGKQASSSHP